MSSDYIKQIEEANTKLAELVESLDKQCRWLEKLRSLRVSTRWSAYTNYRIGINNYKSKKSDGKFVDGERNCPKDAKFKKVFVAIERDTVGKHLTTVETSDKVNVKNAYKDWREVFPAFVSYSAYIFKMKRYAYVDKLSLTTEIEMVLHREGHLTGAIVYPMYDINGNPIYNVKKYIHQAASIIIKRNGNIPKVSVVLKKTLSDGSRNDIKFKGFEKNIRVYSNIFEKIQTMNIV